MELGDDPGEESEDEYYMGPTPSGLQASQHAHTAPNVPATPQKTKTTWTRIWDVEEVFEVMNSGLIMLKQGQLGKKEIFFFFFFFFFFKSVFAYGLDHGEAMSPPEGGPYRLERGAKENYLMKRQRKQHSIAVIGPHTSINTNQYTGVRKASTKLPPQNPSYPTHIPQQYVFCLAS